MKFKTFIGVAVAVLVLFGCGKSPGTNITIESYGWFSSNIDLGFWSDPAPTSTAFNSIQFTFANKNLKAGDLQSVEFTDPDGRTWSDIGSELTSNFDQTYSTYHSGHLWSSSSDHLCAIGAWNVKVIATTGEEEYATVNFAAPGTTVAGSKTHFYTEDYPGPFLSSYVQAPARASSITAVDGGTTLDVTFSVNDSTVYNGWIWTYDSSGNYLSRSEFIRDGVTGAIEGFVNSGSGTFNTIGTANSLSISTADFNEPINISDIAEIRVVLVDGIQYAGSGVWWDYRSISAAVVVP